MSVDFSLPDTAAVVDLDNVHDVTSVAVLGVPAGSRVIALGLRDDAAARALAGRGCRVWAIEADVLRAPRLTAWCETILRVENDLAAAPVSGPAEGIDIVLWLNATEDPNHCECALRHVLPMLAPAGRLVLSMAADATAVERRGLYDFLERFDFQVTEEIRVASAPSSEQERSSVVIAERASRPRPEPLPSLASTLMERVQRAEAECRWLHSCVSDRERQLEELGSQRRAATAALEEARQRHIHAAESLNLLNDTVRRIGAERQQLEEQLAVTTEELTQCQLERRFLRDDVLVKDAYLAKLREELSLVQATSARREGAIQQAAAERRAIEQAHAEERRRTADEIDMLHRRIADAAAAGDAEGQRAAVLAAEHGELLVQLAALRQELHRVHLAIADTMAQPRFVIADRLNAWLRRVGMLHGPLKRAWTARRR